MGILKDLGTLFRTSINLTGYIDTEAAEKHIRNNIYFRGPNAWILAIAIIIASIGLNINSIPMVFGAMLISPLMGPILGIGLGLGVSDVRLMKLSGKNLLVMVIISITASLLYFLITPLSLSNPTELLSRTNPTIYDVLVAVLGGFAGILELCHKKQGGMVLTGVCIATALMPPLCTVGYGIVCGNIAYIIGALYLFFINCLFIMLAAYLSVKYLKFRQTTFKDKATGRRTKRVITFLVVLSIVPSIWSAVILIQQQNFEMNATAFVKHSKSYGKSIIYDYKIDHNDGSTLELAFVGESLDEDTKKLIYETAERYNIKRDNIILTEHTTKERVEEIEMVKDIYDRMDTEISSRDKEISRLKAELEKQESEQIPYLQLTREIRANNPTISEVHITRGEKIMAEMSDSTAQTTIVMVRTNAKFGHDAHQKLENWLKIRLDEEELTLITQPTNK
ncbi:MAG: DUF389 domain-containing protein [Alistipes sp.]|nr:DUF389 domain-containing protein [Alistipes sp.]